MERAGTTLMVASAGGHLTQLMLLAERFEPRPIDMTWVSYNCMQARSALRGRQFVAGHGPSTRHLPNAVRNWHLARQMFDELRINQVISTGSGIAVPFLMEAVRRGVPAHYVESASRVDGPSLSGKMLQRMAPQALLYTQYEGLTNDRWRHAGSIYEGFVAAPVERPRRSGLKILVTLGTHASYRFDRLVTAARSVIGSGDDVVWQLGGTAGVPDLPGQVCEQLPSHQMAELLQWADVVIAHSGTGIILTCLQAGVHPIVVPRRHPWGEHVDDHQVVTARAVHGRGLARWVEPADLSREDLNAAMALTCRMTTVHPFELRGDTTPQGARVAVEPGQAA